MTSSGAFIPSADRSAAIQTGLVIANRAVCREHFRLTLEVPALADVRPGQFAHVAPAGDLNPAPASWWDDDAHAPPLDRWRQSFEAPMLRRAYSIVSVDRSRDRVRFDLIHRVVGKATSWLAALQPGDQASVLGPLGNAFPIVAIKPHAWMIGGGVGVPPLLMLADHLAAAGRRAVAFCGAQSADLFCFDLDAAAPPERSATRATLTGREFAAAGAATVLSTDDGSLGFHGHIGAALTAYHAANPVPSDELVMYACGPERMLRFVAEYAIARGIECWLCMERAMACGMGTCQSCVVPVDEPTAVDGWRYELCCTAGPIFDARRVIWPGA
jgi:dihydroorotate dehydrogenase electron transfer subunit